MKKYFLLGLIALLFMACEQTSTTSGGGTTNFQPIVPGGIGTTQPIDITNPTPSPLPTPNTDPLPNIEENKATLINPIELYENKCASCHGFNGEGITGPKLSGRDQIYTSEALFGYLKGTYGGDKKSIMENVVKDLSAIELEILSVYITIL